MPRKVPTVPVKPHGRLYAVLVGVGALLLLAGLFGLIFMYYE